MEWANSSSTEDSPQNADTWDWLRLGVSPDIYMAPSFPSLGPLVSAVIGESPFLTTLREIRYSITLFPPTMLNCSFGIYYHMTS